MNQKMTNKLMYHFEDQMTNLIFDVEDDDNIEYETCFGWLSEKYQEYYRYLQYYKALYKDLKHPSKKRQKILKYFVEKENYFIDRIKREVDDNYEKTLDDLHIF